MLRSTMSDSLHYNQNRTGRQLEEATSPVHLRLTLLAFCDRRILNTCSVSCFVGSAIIGDVEGGGKDAPVPVTRRH